MFQKLLRSLLVAAPLLATSCTIGPGDYVIYRVAFTAAQNGADCGMPGPSQINDSTTFGAPATVALFAFEDIFYLEFGDDGMGGVAALEGTRNGSDYLFTGTSINVDEIDPDGSSTTATYDVEVAAVIKGKNINAIAVITTSTTCSGAACPADVYPISCTTQTTFQGSQIDDTDIERPI